MEHDNFDTDQPADKKYQLSRFSDAHKWTLTRHGASEEHGGQNTDKMTYAEALAERDRRNAKIKKK